jgi:uncharacterized protein with FMN-binding domain
MNVRTVKSIAALALTGTASVLVMAFKTAPEPVADASTFAASTSSGSTATAPPGSGTARTSANPSATARVAGATYADGTWTGSAVDEPWGTFEVKAVVTDGRITDVVLVASPTDRHSSRINTQAVPRLTASAIATQSANVDMVSGATWTSESYATSLQAALDAAKAAS